ncbi:hypothetical protein [Phenylobacterium sp.]|uniref:hypothetical protein n=1 Tax=Phenylobacterium sp. TaxID=1871053 RepID=UPI003568F321
MSWKPRSAVVLALGGAILMAMALYFIFLRPPLLPEDLRFLGASDAELRSSLPRLSIWLQRVFWVLGGYILATGALTFYVAVTSFRARARGAAMTTAFAGLTSVGLMAAVNVLIASDFKWPLIALAMVWALALVLYLLEGRAAARDLFPGQRQPGIRPEIRRT